MAGNDLSIGLGQRRETGILAVLPASALTQPTKDSSKSVTSLVRLDPGKKPAAGETARPAVLGEAGTSPAEKKSP